MGLHYRKQIKLGRRLTLNLSKGGLSLTLRVGRAGVNLSKKGLRPFIRLGKGFSWRK